MPFWGQRSWAIICDCALANCLSYSREPVWTADCEGMRLQERTVDDGDLASRGGGARGARRAGRSWGPRNARGSSLAGRLHSKELSFSFQDQTCAIPYICLCTASPGGYKPQSSKPHEGR